MLQFIPFEDDWDALKRLRPEDLIPYRVGLLPESTVPPITCVPQGNTSDARAQIASVAGRAGFACHALSLGRPGAATRTTGNKNPGRPFPRKQGGAMMLAPSTASPVAEGRRNKPR